MYICTTIDKRYRDQSTSSGRIFSVVIPQKSFMLVFVSLFSFCFIYMLLFTLFFLCMCYAILLNTLSHVLKYKNCSLCSYLAIVALINDYNHSSKLSTRYSSFSKSSGERVFNPINIFTNK